MAKTVRASASRLSGPAHGGGYVPCLRTQRPIVQRSGGRRDLCPTTADGAVSSPLRHIIAGWPSPPGRLCGCRSVRSSSITGSGLPRLHFHGSGWRGATLSRQDCRPGVDASTSEIRGDCFRIEVCASDNARFCSPVSDFVMRSRRGLRRCPHPARAGRWRSSSVPGSDGARATPESAVVTGAEQIDHQRQGLGRPGLTCPPAPPRRYRRQHAGVPLAAAGLLQVAGGHGHSSCAGLQSTSVSAPERQASSRPFRWRFP